MWLSYSFVFPWGRGRTDTGSGVKSLKYLQGRHGEGGVFIYCALFDISSTLGFDFFVPFSILY